MVCPNSTASGCRCVEHHPGLTAFSRDPALLVWLERLKPALTVVPEPTLPDACDDSMTCACPRCQSQKRKRAVPKQPWEVAA